MTKDEYNELKEQLTDVLIEIEDAKNRLDMLYREKKALQDKLDGNEDDPLSTNIEYLFSRFDLERSKTYCGKATLTKAKNLLHSMGYTDLKQLEGKKFEEFFDLCTGTKQLAVILSYCYKCKVNVDLESVSLKDGRMESIKYGAIRYMEYIIL